MLDGLIAGAYDVRVSDKMLARAAVDYSRRDIDNYFFSGPTQQLSMVYDSQRELTRYAFSPSVDYQVSADTSLAASYAHGKYLRDETRVFVLDGRVAPQAPWREWNDELKLTASHNWRVMGADAPLPWGFTPSLSYNFIYRQNDEGDEIGGYPKHAAFIKLLWASSRLGLRANIRAGSADRRRRHGVDAAAHVLGGRHCRSRLSLIKYFR